MNDVSVSPNRLRGVIVQNLLDEQDALPVRIFECLFTLTFLLWMGRCFLTWRDWLTDAGIHLDNNDLAAMGYPSSWPTLEPWQVLFFGAAILIGALLLLWPKQVTSTLGLPRQILKRPAPTWARRAGLMILFGCALYAQRVDYMAAFTLNKLYVGVFGILTVAPGMRLYAETGRLLQSVSLLRVLQATLMLQYFAAGLAKMDGDWIKSGDVLWGQVQGVYRTELAAWALRHLPLWNWTVQQYLSLFFEVTAPLLFAIQRLRPIAFVLGIGFHLVIALLMKDLIFFSTQMWTFYALFITAEEWRAIGRKVMKGSRFTQSKHSMG
jgi:hypothetical protein